MLNDFDKLQLRGIYINLVYFAVSKFLVIIKNAIGSERYSLCSVNLFQNKDGKVDVQTMAKVSRRTRGVSTGAGGQQADFGRRIRI